jgi:hypothetical protein
MLVHKYATATAEQVHESALLVSGNFATFYDAYRTCPTGAIGRPQTDVGYVTPYLRQ